ncbi:MAG: peptidylprolyl isomerase [Deltaproteobacteria bacterium]|nr:peptidylprolyl isomerase [Candidatus Zymogenaceae bacterium]
MARYDGKIITVDEYLEEFDNLPEHTRASINTPEEKQEFVYRLIRRELLLQEAVRMGLEYDESIQYKIETYKSNLLISEMLERKFSGKIIVTEAEIKEYYTNNLNDFTTETVEASHILVKTREDAENVLALIDRGRNFNDLATEYSFGPGADKGGVLGVITRGQMMPEFEEALFSLEKEGDISPIIETEFGYHIIRLDTPKTTIVKPYDEVKETIREVLSDQKEKELFESFIHGLEDEVDVKINETLLEELG